MDFIISISRYILPFFGIVLLSKCVMSLLLGHPKEKIYAYVTDMNTGERHPLNMWETSIGRSNSSDIVIRYPAISRSHAVLSRRIDGWYVYDLRSKHGIKINGTKIEGKGTLSNGDKITFANVDFRFEIIDDPVQKAGKSTRKGTPAQTNTAQNRNRDIYAQPRIIIPTTGETFMLVGNRVNIGVAPKNDIRLSGRGVSRSHCVLVLYEDGWAITDANSTNGTYLNGKRINQPQLLFDGDTVMLGTQVLKFKTRR